MEVEFNTILASAAKAGRSAASVKDKNPLSLGEALTIIRKKEELECLRRAREFKENKVDMVKMLTLLYKERKVLKQKASDSIQQYQKAKTALTAADNNETQFNYRLAQSKMLQVADRLKDVNEKIGQLETKTKDMVKEKPPMEYLDAGGRSIIAWHEANLEFANANHLNCLSLKHWDQDDEYELHGKTNKPHPKVC